MAFLTRGVTIKFTDVRVDPKRETTFYFEGGVRSFVRYLNKNRTVLHDPIYVEREVDGTLVEAALQYTDGYDESVYTFANTINTPDGGTHLTGLRAALTRTVNDYARKQGMLKDNEANFTGDDTREGLTAIVSVKLPDPQFESQTKVKLLNAEVKQPGRVGGRRGADGVAGAEPARRPQDRREVSDQQPGARRGAQGPRPGDPQERAGER